MLTNEIRTLFEEQQRKDSALFEQWRSIGRVISERKMTEPEILNLFANIEAGMTNKATGANRTWMGRGKDTATDFVGGAKEAFNSIMNSIQTSAPVAAVDTVYDQATDALANLTGGQKGKVMQAITSYRNLVKEYPKTAGFVKAALVAITGLATSGAGLPVIAGLTYALDSAIKGDKLSSVIGKGAGAAALSAAAQGVYGAMSGAGGADAAAGSVDANASADGLTSGSWNDMEHSFDYKVKPGDTLSDILDDRKINPEIAQRLNPELFSPNGNPDIIKAGQTIRLPNPDEMDAWNQRYYTGPGDQMGTYHGQYAAHNPSSLDAANNMRQQGYGKWGASDIAADRVARDAAKLRESAAIFPRFIASTLPIEKLYNRKATLQNIKLKESKNPSHVSIVLTQAGVYKVFENIHRYNDFLFEAAVGPGRSDLPAEYRPDMPGGAGGYDKSKKGIVGKGLDWVDRTAGKIGRGLKSFGHQLTTNVTKEKLKMNWHVDGKKSDSDMLAAFLKNQGVPVNVITDVYSQMGLPVPQGMGGAAPAATTAPTTATTTARTTVPTTATTTAPTATARPTATATAPAGALPSWADPKSSAYVGRREVARRQAATQTTTPKAGTPKLANQGYKSVTMPTAIKYSGLPAEKEKTVTAESLSWSKKFDPGMLVWNKMKSDRN